jgi:hypothetical protein
MINPKKRFQTGLKVTHLFPVIDGYCACGCGIKLSGRKRKWATNDCSLNAYITTAIIKGNNEVIRNILYQRDGGYCKNCGIYDSAWEADHIIPVHKGGGACDITNFQTLCTSCHSLKTNHQRESQRSAISSHDAVRA